MIKNCESCITGGSRGWWRRSQSLTLTWTTFSSKSRSKLSGDLLISHKYKESSRKKRKDEFSAKESVKKK